VAEPATAPTLSSAPAGTIVAVGHGPEGIAVDPLRHVVAVGLRSPAAIAVIDHSGAAVRVIPLPGAPRHLRFREAGGPLLVPAEDADHLLLIDVTSGVVLRSVAVGRHPHDAVARDGTVFVSNEQADSVSVVAADGSVTTVAGPQQPGGVAVTDTSVGILGVRSHTLAVLNPTSLRPVATVAAGVAPTHVVGDSSRFFVADTGGDMIRVFTTAPSVREVATYPAAGRPYGLSLDPVRHHLWVTLTARNSLAEYDITADQPRLIATYPSVRQPNTVAVDSTSGEVFVAGASDGVVQILNPKN